MYDDDLTCHDLVKLWDEDKPVSVVEMGGLGPGYEQCIQIVTVELVRLFKDNPGFSSRSVWDSLPEQERTNLKAEFDLACHEIDRAHKIQLSGAQASAAMNQAYHFLLDGYGASLKQMREVDPERITLASKNFPSPVPVS